MASAALVAAVTARHGFFKPDEVAELAATDADRLTPILVRCGCCRFSAPAQDVKFLTEAVEKAGDYVRDCSLPVGVVLRVHATTADMLSHIRPEVRRALSDT
jgi:hypothetical protein